MVARLVRAQAHCRGQEIEIIAHAAETVARLPRALDHIGTLLLVRQMDDGAVLCAKFSHAETSTL